MKSERIDGISKLFYVYLNPTVCIIGILFNCFNLTVLTSPRLKESPFTYLTGLACADLLTLLFTLLSSITRSYLPEWNDIQIEYSIKRIER